MVHKFIIFIILLVSLSACGIGETVETEPFYHYWNSEEQQKKSVTHFLKDSSTKHGEHREWYANGQVKYEVMYYHGKRNGVETKYYENGQTESKITFEKGVRNGPAITYFESGQIEYKGKYKSNERDGEWVEYYETGQILTKTDYQLGEKSGVFEEYFENGQINIRGNYENNQKNGRWTKWYKDGSLIYDTFLVDGQKEGFGIENVLGTYIGEYKSGMRHGLGLSIDEEGIVWGQGEYQSGDLYNGVSFERWNHHYSDGTEETMYYKNIYENGTEIKKLEISGEQVTKINTEKISFKDGLVGINAGETDKKLIRSFLNSINEFQPIVEIGEKNGEETDFTSEGQEYSESNIDFVDVLEQAEKLAEAVESGDISLVKSLLNAGVDPNIEAYESPSALTIAKYNGYDEIAKLLIEAGAKGEFNDEIIDVVNAIKSGNNDYLKLKLEKGLDPNSVDENQTQLLYISVFYNNLEAVNLLLSAGATQDFDDITPLMYAAETGNKEILRALVNAGGDINKITRNGETALIMAVRAEQTGMVKELINYGVDVNPPIDGYSPLNEAVYYGYGDIIEILKQAGAEDYE